MLNKLALVSVCVLVSLNTFAQNTAPSQDIKFTVRQNIKNRNIVVVQASSAVTIAPGKVFLATLADGRQCTLELKEMPSSTLLTMDATECEESDDITTNTVIEPSLVDIPEKAVNTRDNRGEHEKKPADLGPKFGWRWDVNLYYTAANEANFNDAEVTTGGFTTSFDAKFKTETAVGIGVHLTRMERHSWGLSGGLALETERKINSLVVNGVNSLPSNAKVNFAIIEGNAIYRWNQFYLPFGVNVSGVSIHDTGAENVTVHGGLGVFVGVGYLVNDHISFELFARSIGFNMTESDPSGSIDFGDGTLSGVGIGAKYFF